MKTLTKMLVPSTSKDTKLWLSSDHKAWSPWLVSFSILNSPVVKGNHRSSDYFWGILRLNSPINTSWCALILLTRRPILMRFWGPLQWFILWGWLGGKIGPTCWHNSLRLTRRKMKLNLEATSETTSWTLRGLSILQELELSKGSRSSK